MATDAGQLGHNVRAYLHYDQLSSNMSRQSLQARQMAGQFEHKILDQLNSSRMSNAVIQIGGGRLNVVEEKSPHALSLRKIESLIHGYYASRGTKVRDETDEIMRYIRSNRGSDTKQRLKKTLNANTTNTTVGGGTGALPPSGGPTA